MCLVSAPKVVQQTPAQNDKPVPVLRNPFLDGVAPIIRAQTTGLSSLRINRTTPSASPTSSLAITRPATPSPVVQTQVG